MLAFLHLLGSETFWTAALAVATAALAGIAWRQASQAIIGQRRWATLQACDRYDRDRFIQKAVEALKVPSRTDLSPSEKHLYATRLMNYFGSIAIGMRQEFYDRNIAKAHLQRILFRRYSELIDRQWLTVEEAERDFGEVMWLMSEWRDLAA